MSDAASPADILRTVERASKALGIWWEQRPAGWSVEPQGVIHWVGPAEVRE